MSDNQTSKQTILENGTEIEGAVRSKCPIVVSGHVKGEVSTPSLTVTQEGSVEGKVKVSQLKSEGALAGEIDAETVELSGSVSDNTVIRAASLEVKLKQSANSKLQVAFGNCELHIGDPSLRANHEKNGHKKEVAPEAVVVAGNGHKPNANAHK